MMLLQEDIAGGGEIEVCFTVATRDGCCSGETLDSLRT